MVTILMPNIRISQIVDAKRSKVTRIIKQKKCCLSNLLRLLLRFIVVCICIAFFTIYLLFFKFLIYKTEPNVFNFTENRNYFIHLTYLTLCTTGALWLIGATTSHHFCIQMSEIQIFIYWREIICFYIYISAFIKMQIKIAFYYILFNLQAQWQSL